MNPVVKVRTLRWAAVAAVGLALVAALVFASRFDIDPSLSASPLIDQAAPEAVLPRLGTDGVVNLADLRGDVVVVNFWGSWCTFCVEEHPDLLATSDAYADRGVQFVGVVYRDRPSSAMEFLDRHGWGDHYLYVTDSDYRLAIDLGVRGAPETFFIDPSGVVVAKISGTSDALLLSTTIDEILAGGRPGASTVGEVQTGPDG